MSLMARVLSWNPFKSRNFWNYFFTCLFFLLPYVYLQRNAHVLTYASEWLLCLLGFIVWRTEKHYIIKSPAPEFLKLSEEMVRSIHTLVNGSDMRLNKRQCLDLSSKLSQTIQNVQELSNQCRFSNRVLGPSLKRLYQVLVKAKLLVNDCSNENWIRTSVFQIQNESAFQVILMDVGFCYHEIYEQAKLSMSGEWRNVELEDLRDSSTFKPASVKDVDEDREELRERLENLVDARNYDSRWLFRVYYFLLVRLSKKLRLAEYLLVKLHCIAQQPLADGLQLSKRLIWEEESHSSMTWGREIPLGVGSGASGVCKTKWLSIPCAKKCNIPERYFSKEAGILSHANYPNIIKFICCGKKSELVEDFIALELMEMSLSDLIKEKKKRGLPFPDDAAVDIMAQIGRGMCYLHGLSVAHRDLKPANVVLNVLTSPHLEDTYHVKLVDFGTSKTQVDPTKSTSTEHGFGTLTHKAPEVRDLAPPKSEGDRKWRAVWFKADVWSFAIICLEVLSLELRKSRDKGDQDLNSMFPPRCTEALAALLKDCLQANPRARPDFLEVCSRLEALRHSLSRQLPTSDQDSLSEISTYCSHNQFIEMRLKEHFKRRNAGDDKEEVLTPQTSHAEPRADREVFRMDQASSSTTNEDRDLEIWRKQPGNEVFREALARQRMDQAPYYTTVEYRDLEIWTKQPGNEVFRKAVEEWREECKMITERIRITKQQQWAVIDHLFFKRELHTKFVCSINYVIHITSLSGISISWTCSPVLLEGLFNLCWTIYQFRCLWRLFKAVHSDVNKLMVFNKRFDMLNQKRDFFSFEDDAKDYDPSSNSPPKLTWLLLDCVQDVFGGLLLIMGFSNLYLLDVKEYDPPKLTWLLLGYANEVFLELLLNIGFLNFYLHDSPSSKLTWLLAWMLTWLLLLCLRDVPRKFMVDNVAR